VLSAPLLSDYFPPHERTVAFAFFNMAAPLGGAIGFGAGGLLASRLGWRIAFSLVGCPGIIAAMFVLQVRDPIRGLHDTFQPVSGAAAFHSNAQEDEEAEVACSAIADICRILRNPHYLMATVGSIGMSFAIGGIADWGASFLQRYNGASMASAGILVGSVTAIAGVGGTVLGAKTVEHFERRVRSAAFFFPAVYSVPAAFMMMLVMNWTGSLARAYFFLLSAQICLWTHMAPIQNLALSVLPADLRARSNALSLVAGHLLGDIPSPPIIGEISDMTGSLVTGMQVTWMGVLFAGSMWLFGFACLAPVRLAADRDDTNTTTFASLLRPDMSSTAHESSGETTEEDTETGEESSNTLESNGHIREVRFRGEPQQPGCRAGGSEEMDSSEEDEMHV